MAEERMSRRDGAGLLKPAPVVVLVDPQLGENIGAAARAMLNFGLSELRIVNPRDGWPNPAAVAMASGAVAVIDAATAYPTTVEALADCRYVLAATARPREMLLPVVSPREAVLEMHPRIARGERCAVLFGGERRGLVNEDVALADAVLSIPVNPAFASLNLAQAVLVLAYEWAIADGRRAFGSDLDAEAPAPKADFERLMDHLIAALDARNYFFPPEKRETMERNIRVALQRAALTESEIRAFRGVIKSLERRS